MEIIKKLIGTGLLEHPVCNRTQCPKDYVSFGINHTPIDQLPTNYALLTLICNPSEVNI